MTFHLLPRNNIWRDTGTAVRHLIQESTSSKPPLKLWSGVSSWPPTPATSYSTRRAVPALRAIVAEQWGRRWITIDTSRVALALARARIMGARYPFYLLADSREGQAKESEVSNRPHRLLLCAEISAKGSSTSACRTLRLSPSPTTPRSMSSGTSGRRSWSRCARS